MAAGGYIPIPSVPPPMFVDDADGLDVNLILNDMIAAWEQATGKTVYPAQVERLFIDAYAYRESLVRAQIQYAGLQCLLAFSNYPALDYLGQLLGVTRLAAQPAITTILFTLANALTVPFTIPAGTQVGTQDGLAIFATNTDLIIQAGQTTGSVTATATTAGVAANGYLCGQVSILITPSTFIASAANTTTTSGGAALEKKALRYR